MAEPIWQSKLDDRFSVRVTRLSARLGSLTVQDSDQRIIFQKSVRLAYGARFGPDAADVRCWAAQCEEFIDLFVRGEREPEIEDLSSIEQSTTTVHSSNVEAEWQKIKADLDLMNTGDGSSNDPQEAVAWALQTLGPSRWTHPLHSQINKVLEVAAFILGSYQIHVHLDDEHDFSYSIFWRRRNRWMAGSNLLYNLACAVDYEIQKPFVFDPKHDYADPDGKDARLRDALVGLDRP